MKKINVKKTNKILFKVLLSFILLYLLFTAVWFQVLLGIITVLVLLFMFKIWLNNGFLTKTMRLYNTHVFGKKGRGKDLQTQLVIYKRYSKIYKKNNKKLLKQYKELNNPIQTYQQYIDTYYHYFPLYISNIDYGYGARIIDLSELELKDTKTNKLITYNDIITGAYKKMKIIKKDIFEGKDLYISDAQLGLPNTEHNTLDKMYPWLPVFIALSRQLYNMNVVVNTQEYSRLWIKLRGQQDVYLKALDTLPVNKSFFQRIWFKIPILKKYIFMRIRFFEEQQSAENNILPFNAKGLINEGSKHVVLTSGQATKEQFEATNGKIKELLCVIRIDKIKYDTRIFHKYIFGYKFIK